MDVAPRVEDGGLSRQVVHLATEVDDLPCAFPGDYLPGQVQVQAMEEHGESGLRRDAGRL